MTLISNASFKKIEQIVRKILDAFHLKHFSYKMIISSAQLIALYRLRKIMKNSSPPDKIEKPKKVLFISIDARHMPHTYLEAGIGKFLQVRGHNSKMILCNGVLNMCTTHFNVDKPCNKWSCNNCKTFSKRFYETINLPYSTYDDYISQGQIEKIYKTVNKMSYEECKDYVYKGIKVGYHAKTSADRYFKGDIPEKSIYEPILRDELVNAMISTDVAEKAYEIEKADILVESHGCYSSWGSFSDFFIDKGVETYIWGSGESNSSTFIVPKPDFGKYFNEVRQKKLLNDLEEKELDNFINRRYKGEEGQVVLYGFSDTDENKLKDQFHFNKYDKTYVMFPNVPWDAAIFGDEDNMPFNDIYDWFSYNVELFKEKPNYQLIIKIHPSEVKLMESKKTLTDFIEEKLKPLPENVKIIPPTTTISPYSLFPFIDVGLVYTGTVGLEMSLNNIPVIPAGDAHYGKKGFTFDAKSKEEYSKLLFDDIKVSSKQKNLAKVYAHYHFIKSFLPRSFVFYSNFINLGWKIKSFDDIKPGKDKYVDHLCDYIINGGVFQDW